MLPAAPARLSMTTDCPKASPSLTASATLLPWRSPNRPLWVTVIAPAKPGATVLLLKTNSCLAPSTKAAEARNAPPFSQKYTVPVIV